MIGRRWKTVGQGAGGKRRFRWGGEVKDADEAPAEAEDGDEGFAKEGRLGRRDGGSEDAGPPMLRQLGDRQGVQPLVQGIVPGMAVGWEVRMHGGWWAGLGISAGAPWRNGSGWQRYWEECRGFRRYGKR